MVSLGLLNSRMKDLYDPGKQRPRETTASGNNGLGLQLFQQALVLDTQAGNVANAVVSDAAKVRIGS